MAIGTNLPPQAYTRETLTQAFNWLQTQPESVKQGAANPAALVALFRRSQRFGTNTETDAPVSSQNFITDLKTLAEGLKQFEQPSQLGYHPHQAPAPAVVSQPAQAPMGSAAPAQRTGPAAASISSNPANTASWVEALHPKSQAMIAQIKSQLNLTSDAEAVNMMIAVAYKTVKNLI